MDRIGRFALNVGVARVDPAEVGEQRDKSAISLKNAVSHLMDLSDLHPAQDGAGRGSFQDIYL
jgi:hypothetical protein